MKTIITILLTFFITTVYGQTDYSTMLLDSAKTLFNNVKNLEREEFDNFNYYEVVDLLEQVIQQDPENAEARYFLGYTYSRINSRDGRSMINMNLELLKKSSEQLEKVIKLTPKYSDEIIVLDPYSKLTSEWGAMAMSYLYHNKVDSAIWAFKEGKTRGGFSKYILEINKKVLNTCSQNSILISSGDNYSFPLWYLQTAENYRTDVTVIDISLLNTIWYPAYLSKSKLISFDILDEMRDTIEYMEWKDSTIKIDNFSWTVKPSYYDQYLLRGDLLFLSLLSKNKFHRELSFTRGFADENKLSLNNFITASVFTDKLSVFDKTNISFEEYKKQMTSALSLTNLLNKNSQDDLKFLDNFRYDIFIHVNDYLSNNEKKKAKELMKLLTKFANEKSYPYQDEKGNEYIDYLKEKL